MDGLPSVLCLTERVAEQVGVCLLNGLIIAKARKLVRFLMKFSHGDDRAGEWNGFYGTISATDMSTSTYLKTVKITLKNKVPVPLESCNIRKKQHQRYFILPESLQADA